MTLLEAVAGIAASLLVLGSTNLAIALHAPIWIHFVNLGLAFVVLGYSFLVRGEP